MIDQTISHYKIIEKLGEGGMGVVYKAEDLRLKRSVALKFLPPHLTHDSESVERFMIEAQAASSLDHQNICTIYQIDASDDGRKFISMAFYEGVTLKDKISSAGATPEGAGGRSPVVEDAIDIAIQIARGLAKAHEKGIVHRDIKPGNIIIRDDGMVKIIDFGLSKLLGGVDLTQTGHTTKGTIAYMSPEQAQGQRVDHRSDIWSLGVIIYEMLTGKRPFQGEYDMAILYSIVNEEAQRLETVCDNVPKGFQQLIDNMLAKEPRDRYQSMSEVLQDLKLFHRQTKTTKRVRPRRQNKKTPKKSAVTAGILLITMMSILFVIFKFPTIFKSTSKQITTDSNLIAVLPFNIKGGKDIAFLKEGVMDLLSMKFDGAGELQRVDPFAIQSYLTAKSIENIDVQKGRIVAENFHAGKYVMGNVYEVGGNIQMTARLYNNQMALLQAAETKSSNTADLFSLVDEIGRKLLLTQLNNTENSLQRLESISTSSSTALKFYLEGESYLRAGRYDAAVAAYKKAVNEDSTFAMAYYRIAYSSSFEARYGHERQSSLEKALKYKSRLSRRDQMLLKALHYKHTRRIGNAIALYQSILESYPNEFEAWFLLGTIMENFGPRLGTPVQEIYAPILQAYRLKPNDPIVTAFVQTSSWFERDFDKTISLTKRRLALSHGGTYERFNMALIAFWGNEKQKQKKILEKLNVAYGIEVWFTSLSVMMLENFEGAEKLARILLATHRSDHEKYLGYQALAMISFVQGKYKLAFENIHTAENYAARFPHMESVRMFLAPFVHRSESAINAYLQKARSTKNQDIPSQISRHYILGAMNLELKRTANAESFVDSLRIHAAKWADDEKTAALAELAKDLSHSLQAAVFWQSGQAEKTLAELQKLRLEGWWGAKPGNQIQSQGFERYLRVLALVKLGRVDEAMKWLSTLGYGSYPEIIYRVPRHILVGEIYEKMGEPQKALENYQIVIKLWRDCDPELRPVVEDINHRIAQLNN